MVLCNVDMTENVPSGDRERKGERASRSGARKTDPANCAQERDTEFYHLPGGLV